MHAVICNAIVSNIQNARYSFTPFDLNLSGWNSKNSPILIMIIPDISEAAMLYFESRTSVINVDTSITKQHERIGIKPLENDEISG